MWYNSRNTPEPWKLESEKTIRMSLLTQFLSGMGWVLYGSFFEWYYHKYWMHMPRVPKEAFRGHTIVHHGLYRGDERYFVKEGEHPEHILLKAYALPAIILAHLPVVLGIEYFLVPHTAIGALVACVLYFVVYEYCHWNMHVPRNHYIERFRWFQFLRKHHHLHHRLFQTNFCVLIPLADWCMGTLATEASLERRRLEREKVIASGEKLSDRRAERDRKRARVSTSSVSTAGRPKRWSLTARSFALSEAKRFRENYRTGRPRASRSSRELQETLKNRQDP